MNDKTRPEWIRKNLFLSYNAARQTSDELDQKVIARLMSLDRALGNSAEHRTFSDKFWDTYQDTKDPLETVREDTAPKRHLTRPPGSLFETVVRFVYSPKTREAVFDQIIFDMREEYNEALFDGKRWKARWIRVRGTSAIFTAMGLHRIGSLAKKVVLIWKAI